MILRSVCMLMGLSALAAAQARPSAARAEMEQRVLAAIAPFPGTVCLFAKNLDSGETFSIRGDEAVRTASTIKLPILAAVFAAVAEGKVHWTDPVTLHEKEKVGGSGILQEFSAGDTFPFRDIVQMMIVVSDNTATNLVLDRVPADYVNAQLDKLGLTRTRSLRKIMSDGPAAGLSREGNMEEYKRFGLGVSTPHEMVTLLERLSKGEVVSPEASSKMLDILKHQQYKDGIGRHMADDVASKSGALDRLRSDVGIVYSKRGRVAIAVTVDDMPKTDYSPDNPGNILISRISEFITEGLAGPETKTR